MCLGRFYFTVKTALENAYAGTGSGGGSILVAAAGNDGYKVDPPFPPSPIYAPMYPACYSFVIGVEASTQAGVLAGFSKFLCIYLYLYHYFFCLSNIYLSKSSIFGNLT